MAKLEGKIALVTGGTSGIGLAAAKQFVKEGAYVFITGRRDSELAAAVKGIGRNVNGVQGDVSSLGDLDRLFAQIKREKGKVDVVFANAGVAKYAPFGNITEELYDTIFNTNVRRLLFTRKTAPATEVKISYEIAGSSRTSVTRHESVSTCSAIYRSIAASRLPTFSARISFDRIIQELSKYFLAISTESSPRMQTPAFSLIPTTRDHTKLGYAANGWKSAGSRPG